MRVSQVGATAVFGIAALTLLIRVQSQTTSVGLQISAATIDFGEVALDSESPPHTVTITNPTKSSITMEQIIASGIDFSEKNDCGRTVAPGAQCTVQVLFKPAIPGPRIGNLGVTGSDPASPHFIALAGTGK